MHSSIMAVSIWQKLEEVDKWLFLKLNSGVTNGFFDAVFPYLRDSVFWAPLYLFIIGFMLVNYGTKGLWWSLLFICTVAIADVIGARVFKAGFQRLRPCHDPEFSMYVRLLLKHCSGSYSFVSNHAANHFGLATFMVITFRGVLGRWMYATYLWAFFIVYAQVYVGVHYPLDVLGGAALGTAAGIFTAWLFHKKFGRLNLLNQVF